ncbi:cutinase 1 [Rhexocercosporidium sp. MPI-PUGE-AT-0058]|nr:cutinase 1 [Rhexocercosporidium sp. MPI-PUGE-AT-0058]
MPSIEVLEFHLAQISHQIVSALFQLFGENNNTKMSKLFVSFVALLAMLDSTSAVTISASQCMPVGTIEHEYTLGGCRPVIFFYARGSTETLNMGDAVYSPGPPTAKGLRDIYGCDNIAVEGIDYGALVETNYLPGGARPGEAMMMHDLLINAASQCPQSSLLVGAYSQGAALTHRAIEILPENVMSQISGVVLYGDTQNLQDQGQIPNFSKAKTLVICNEGDVICAGNLTITYPHIGYVARVPEALSFFKDQLENTRK